MRTSVSSSAWPTAVWYGPAVEARPSAPRACRTSPGSTQTRVERRADRGEVLGRVGLAQRAAQGAAVAHRRVGDHALGVAEDREQVAEQLRLEELAVAGHRPDPDDVAVLPRCSSSASCRSLMSTRYSGVASRSFIIGSRLWPAGDDPRLLPEPLEQPDGVLDAGGPRVLDRRGHLHAVIVGRPPGGRVPEHGPWPVLGHTTRRGP